MQLYFKPRVSRLSCTLFVHFSELENRTRQKFVWDLESEKSSILNIFTAFCADTFDQRGQNHAVLLNEEKIYLYVYLCGKT